MTIAQQQKINSLRGKCFGILKTLGVTCDSARSNLLYLAIGKRSMSNESGITSGELRNFLGYLRDLQAEMNPQSENESEFLASL